MTQADSVHSTPPSNTPTNNAAGDPESPQDSLYLPTDVSHDVSSDRQTPQGSPRRDQSLIGFLDKTDDYVSRELEDSIDDGPHDDDELDGPENAEDEASEPDEPSLGAFEGQDDQSVSWKCGNRSDRELDGGESGVGDQDGLDEQVRSATGKTWGWSDERDRRYI